MSEIPIKSVKRVFEILELFDQQRRPLAAKEISNHLGYPLMSAHALLKSMHNLGYADFDAPSWSYTLSRNILDVVDWARDFLDRETDVLALAAAANRETRETINLSRRANTHIKILHGHETLEPVGVSVKAGTEMPATLTLTGITALACLSEREFSSFWRRLKTAHPDHADAFDPGRLQTAAQELTDQGTVAGYDLFIKGIGAVCLPVKAKTTNEVLIIGVVGPSERIRSREQQHRDTLLRLTEEYAVEVYRPQETLKIET